MAGIGVIRRLRIRSLLRCFSKWQSSVLPNAESALKCPHILVPEFLKFLRQTGARPFVQVQYATMGLYFGSIGRFSSSLSSGSRIAFGSIVSDSAQACRVSNVDEGEVFPRFHSSFHFVHRDSRSHQPYKSPPLEFK